MPLTRRDLLHRIAAVGGASLTYDAMTGLGPLEAQTRAPFDLQGQVEGVRVVVIGAGLAGLTAAYELGKLGYKVQVLEARPRPGGRAHTVRRGTVSEEDGPSQTAAFDEGGNFNRGAMRTPYHDSTARHYSPRPVGPGRSVRRHLGQHGPVSAQGGRAERAAGPPARRSRVPRRETSPKP